MVEHTQFIPAGAMSDAPSLAGAPRSSSSSSYYSTTSPYSMPSQCDSHLLTPVSSQARSPLLPTFHNRPGDYPPPPGSPRSQVQTPPGEPKMYSQWQPQFDMAGHSHATHQQFFVADERRGHAPSDPYPNMCTMADAEQHHMTPYLDQTHMGAHNPVMMRGHLPGTIEPPHHAARTLPSSGTLLSSTPYARTPRRFSTEAQTLRGQAMGTPASPGPSGSGSPRRGAPGLRARKRQAKRPSASSRPHMEQDPAEDHRNCYGQEVPPMLKTTIPDEERCIFESRWKHRGHRGQDMWDKIQQDFNDRFGKSHNKEMLQMKFKRARTKYIIWADKDLEILRDAFIAHENNRYQAILNTFLEMGGSRNMRINAGDIEAKLVTELKYEEDLYIPGPRDTDLRRRRKVSSKKRQGDEGPSSVVDGRPPINEDDVIDQVMNRPDQHWDTDSAHSEPVDVAVWDARAPIKMQEAPPHMMRLVNDGSGRSVFQ